MSGRHPVYTDDSIHESLGELIELKGWVLPVPIAYVFIGAFLFPAVVSGGLMFLLGASVPNLLFRSFVVGVLSFAAIRRALTKDLTVRALLQSFAASALWWWRYRTDAVREARSQRPGLLKLKPIKRKKRRA